MKFPCDRSAAIREALRSVGLRHRHQSLLHHGAVADLAVGRHVPDFGHGDDDAFAALEHAAGGAQLAIPKGGQKVDLVFDRGHFPARGRHRQAGIAAGDVCQRAHGAAMKAALLLGHAV